MITDSLRREDIAAALEVLRRVELNPSPALVSRDDVRKMRAAQRGLHYQFQLRVRRWKRMPQLHARFTMLTQLIWQIEMRNFVRQGITVRIFDHDYIDIDVYLENDGGWTHVGSCLAKSIRDVLNHFPRFMLQAAPNDWPGNGLFFGRDAQQQWPVAYDKNTDRWVLGPPL
jgi:hypothetical protein